MPYEISRPLKSLGAAVHFDGIGAPMGVSLSNQLAELLRNLSGQLGLVEMGVVTPWATRISDLQWKEIVKPDTNIATFRIDDAAIQTAQNTILFGQRLPFLTVLTGQLQTSTELKNILDGSMYELFETQAVYRQDDKDAVPNILFLHWLRVLSEDDIPRSVKSMSAVAGEMFGQLLYSQQVPVESSTLRGAPAISFAQAFGTQEPDPLFNPTVITEVPTQTPIQTSVPATQANAGGVNLSSEMLLPLLFGVVSAVSTAYVAQRLMKK